MDKLYEHERLYKAKREAGPELYDALERVLTFFGAENYSRMAFAFDMLAKVRADSPAPPRKDIAE